MTIKTRFTAFFSILASFLLASLLLTACSITSPTASQPQATAVGRPEWYGMKLTDVQTGKTFTMNDFTGKVVLVESMAMWCPTCLVQAAYVRNMHKALGNPSDLISISLDEDLNEDAASLKQFAYKYEFDWRFAVAPLLVDRALGNLYGAEYLNPPLAPMLLIDRAGNAHQLDFGLKSAEQLQAFVEPYLKQ